MTKRGFTLVELIFSIVIIAIVFTVIPKLMYVTSKTMEISIKEDGLFAALSLMGNIARLPWDSNSTDSGGKILDTAASSACVDYRVGGFAGSRNCIDSDAAATPKSGFGTLGTYADIDDYDGYSTTTSGGRVDYNLSVDVNYTDVDFNASSTTNEVKEIVVKVNTITRSSLCSSFFYYSANLGSIKINKRAW